MDSPACHVIYVNRNVDQERLVRVSSWEESADGWQDSGTRKELQPLLEAFGEGLFHTSNISSPQS